MGSSTSSSSTVPGINSCLPFKLRHKARTTVTDSDSGSDTNGNGIDCPLSDKILSGVNVDGALASSLESNLQTENFTLRRELERLANEVNSLKSYIKPKSSGNNNQNSSSSPSITTNGYSNCDDYNDDDENLC